LGGGIRLIVKLRIVIEFRSDLARQRAAEIGASAKAAQHMGEIEFRMPAQLAPRAVVDIDAVDLGKQPPAARRIELRSIGIERPHHACGITRQRREMVRLEWGCSRDDIAGETDPRRTRGSEQMGADRVRYIQPAIEQLVGLCVVQRVGRPHCGIVVVLRKEARP
jgi:hypothetical protein